MQTIRTKFHKLLPLVQEDEVYISSAHGGMAPHWDELKPDKKMFIWLIENFSQLPKFVIDDELSDLAQGEKFHQSLLDMKKADVFRLPFPAMTVEFNIRNNSARVIVMLRDNKFNDKQTWEPEDWKTAFHDLAFYGVVFIIEEDGDGSYLVINAGMIGIDIKDEAGQAMLMVSADNSNLFKDEEKQIKIVGETFHKNCSYIWKALCAAMLLMHTDGVAKEVIECDKINKKRKKDGKPLIPTHTYLRIGRVYRSSSSDESSEYIPRRSPRPHWRRGHLKTYWHGPKKTLKKQRYINPRIIALKEEIDDEPSMKKTYQVSM